MYEFGIDFVARCIAASAKEALQEQLGNVVIKVITKEEYDSIEHDGNTVYYVVDRDKVVQYFGETKLSSGASSGNITFLSNAENNYITGNQEVNE